MPQNAYRAFASWLQVARLQMLNLARLSPWSHEQPLVQANMSSYEQFWLYFVSQLTQLVPVSTKRLAALRTPTAIAPPLALLIEQQSLLACLMALCYHRHRQCHFAPLLSK